MQLQLQKCHKLWQSDGLFPRESCLQSLQPSELAEDLIHRLSDCIEILCFPLRRISRMKVACQGEFQVRKQVNLATPISDPLRIGSSPNFILAKQVFYMLTVDITICSTGFISQTFIECLDAITVVNSLKEILEQFFVAPIAFFLKLLRGSWNAAIIDQMPDLMSSGLMRSGAVLADIHADGLAVFRDL